MARKRNCGKKKKYMILCTGHKSDKLGFGRGFYISGHIMCTLLDFELM
jgi:hypothetical protein